MLTGPGPGHQGSPACRPAGRSSSSSSSRRGNSSSGWMSVLCELSETASTAVGCRLLLAQATQARQLVGLHTAVAAAGAAAAEATAAVCDCQSDYPITKTNKACSSSGMQTSPGPGHQDSPGCQPASSSSG
jgi:hypothetical protein